MSDLPRPAGDPSNDPQDPSKGKVPVLQPSDVREQQQVELQTLRQSAPPEPSAAEARAMALVAMMTDGDLSPEERDELRATFQANPDLLQAYVEQAVAHAVLEWRYMRKEDYADLRGVEPGEALPHPTRRRGFEVHGQLSLRPLSGDGSGMTPTLPPGMAVQFIDGPRRRHRRGPLVAGGFLAGAALAAALFLWAPWSQKRQQNPPLTAPPEPQQAAVYVGFDTWSAVGGTLRKQLNPKMVAWTPKGLIYPKLACSGGALKIDAANDQFLWLDLDADLVVPPERNVGALPAVRKDRGQDVRVAVRRADGHSRHDALSELPHPRRAAGRFGLLRRLVLVRRKRGEPVCRQGPGGARLQLRFRLYPQDAAGRRPDDAGDAP